MRTLKEQWGNETKFTRSLATDIGSLNKINDLVGLPQVHSAVSGVSISNGSIDVVGYTAKNCAIVYEHQDITGKADQTHAAKTIRYATALQVSGTNVIGAILLCDSAGKHFLDEFALTRQTYERRPKKCGYANVHIVKSQWTDSGEYVPALFEDNNTVSDNKQSIEFYKEFYEIYAPDWYVQREEKNGTAITLWSKIIELPFLHMAYVHTLKNSVKVGLHYFGSDPAVETFLKAVCPHNWTYSAIGEKRRTISRTFTLDVPHQTLWLEIETLKQSVRRYMRNTARIGQTV